MSLNPEDRKPAIIDPASIDARLITVWESGAILAYLVNRTGQLLPSAPVKRCKTLIWVFFRMTAIKRLSVIGPIFGQLKFFLRGGLRTMKTSGLDSALPTDANIFGESRIAGWKVATGLSAIIQSQTS